MGENGIGIVE